MSHTITRTIATAAAALAPLAATGSAEAASAERIPAPAFVNDAQYDDHGCVIEAKPIHVGPERAKALGYMACPHPWDYQLVDPEIFGKKPGGHWHILKGHGERTSPTHHGTIENGTYTTRQRSYSRSALYIYDEWRQTGSRCFLL